MAETALAPAPEQTLGRVADWTEAQKALIKRTVAKDATDDELALFLHVARTSGLDPLRKQIYFVKRRYRDKEGKWQESVSIQAGIDGMQARAAREADYRGTKAGVVYQKDAFVYDKAKNLVTKHEGNPFEQGMILGAWATTFREGHEPYTAIVKLGSFRDDRSPFWNKMPEVMIEKVARATTLRRAYPEQLGHVYEPSEMGRSSLEAQEEPPPGLPPEAPPDQPPPSEGVPPTEPAPTEPEPPPATTPPASGTRGKGPDALVGRRQVVWAKAKALGMSDASFKVWAKNVLGHEKPSKDWSAEDLTKVEQAIREDASSMEQGGEGPTS